ncbi:MAG: hypothetical protein LH468_07955 [Nocardioides sp.]|nr:hypothetical protein [Nocardioides sp.]
MDPSALIFVALAVAWAAYLIPQALEHHEESARSRSIDRFSKGLRILARREPMSRHRSTLVTVADPVEAEPEPDPVLTPEEVRARLHARRRGAARAARRRRRVLDLLFVAAVAVAAVAIWEIVAWVWLAVPAGLVLVWLVVCRLAVRRQRRRRAVLLAAPAAETSSAGPLEVEELAHGVPQSDGAAPLETGVSAATRTEGPQDVQGWEMMPFVVPTYVVKEQVRRSVRTIELDSTGVWSSGRNDIDSALVRDSAAAAQTVRDEQDDECGERALGS